MSKTDTSGRVLDIRLFGPFEARVRGCTLRPLRTRKGEWLLALLALRNGHDVPRDWLASLLWPDSEDRLLLPNLRRTLTDLRDALGKEVSCLQSPTANTLRLDLGRDVWVDVAAFDEAVGSGSIPRLEEAVRLYRGPLLEGCREEWVYQERLQREQAWLRAMETLARHALERGKPLEAVPYLQRLIVADPLHEEGYRLLIQALADARDYAAMTQAYRQLHVHLRRELNATPSPETTALFRKRREEMRGKGPVEPSPSTAIGDQTAQATEDLPPTIAVPNNLPVPLTSFIGREKEREAVREQLAAHRLVTLMGAGGIGKSRLALQVVSEVRDEYPDGVWWIELAALSEGALVPRTVASVLGIPEEMNRPTLQTLTEALRSRSLLLVLDNCEHLLDACASLASTLLLACTNLRLVTTSRARLNVQGEAVWRVPSLTLPEPHDSAPKDTTFRSRLMVFDGVRLFVERALVRHPAFTLTKENASLVVQICRRLDGIPLAIELAAARIQMLSVEQIAERLSAPFQLLSRGNQGAPPRQQTLRAALDWSYDLLSEPERVLLGSLSVFAGGWTLEAAEAVGEAVGLSDVLDLLTSLVENSLVVCEDRGQERRRYQLLETVRQYGQEKLQTGECEEVVRERHAHWFLNFAQGARRELQGLEQKSWIDRLEQDHDNLREALTWFKKQPTGGKAGLEMAGVLGHFWYVRGHLTEGRQWLAEMLSLAGDERTVERAKALYSVGTLARNQGDLAAARAAYEQAMALFEELGNRKNVASSLNSLGSVAYERSDYAQANTLYNQALALHRELNNPRGVAYAQMSLAHVAQIRGDLPVARTLFESSVASFREEGDRRSLANALYGLGTVVHEQGDLAAARRFLEASLDIRRELGSRVGIAESLYNLGEVAESEGNLGAARTLLEESLAMCRELGDQWGMSNSLCSLGRIHHAEGDFSSARRLHRESLAIRDKIGSRNGITESLEELASLAATQRQWETTARLWGAAESLREAMGAPLKPGEQEGYQACVSAARRALGEAHFAALQAEGRAMPLEDAVRYALSSGNSESSDALL